VSSSVSQGIRDRAVDRALFLGTYFFKSPGTSSDTNIIV